MNLSRVRRTTSHQILTIFAFAVLLFGFVISGRSLAVSTNHSTTAKLRYKINDQGTVSAEYNLLVTNNSPSSIILDYYSFAIPVRKVKDLRIKHNGKDLTYTGSRKHSETIVNINTQSYILKPHTKTSLDVRFTLADASEEINIPTLLTGIDVTEVQLITPVDFHYEYISTPPNSTRETNKHKVLIYTNPEYKSIVLRQTVPTSFSYQVTKTYDNETDIPRTVSIPLPAPDLFSDTIVNEVHPTPTQITKDTDGNTELLYTIPSYDSLTVNLNVILQNRVRKDTGNTVTQPPNTDNPYWKFTERMQSDLANYSPNRPNIYNIPDDVFRAYMFVLHSLDQNEISSETIRGGTAVYDDRSRYISSLDYADILLSILAHEGYTVREVVGYIINSDASLHDGADFAHTWVQYKEQDTQNWTDMDPALDAITGRANIGMLDDHIPILIHYTLPSTPKLTLRVPDDLLIAPYEGQTDHDYSYRTELAPTDVTELDKFAKISLQIENTGNMIIDHFEIPRDDFKRQDDDSHILLPGDTSSIVLLIPTDGYEEAIDTEVPITAVYIDGRREDRSVKVNIPISRVNWVNRVSVATSAGILLLVLGTMYLYFFVIRPK